MYMYAAFRDKRRPYRYVAALNHIQGYAIVALLYTLKSLLIGDALFHPISLLHGGFRSYKGDL